MVIAQLLEDGRSLGVRGGDRECRLMELDSPVDRVATTCDGAGSHDGFECPRTHCRTSLGLVCPGEVGPVGQQRPPIVMRHELDECLIVRTGQVLEPGRGARMGASPPREWDALVRDIEDECVLERELDLTADAGRRPRHHEPLRFETDQGVVDGRPIDRQGDG